MNSPSEISIEIYGQTFTLRAEPDEVEHLQRVAREVNEFLKAMARKGTAPIHRLALMAAFQYAYELDTHRQKEGLSPQLAHKIDLRIERIIAKLQAALEEPEV
ncbi:MAG TPA: cell division protein ZapA [Candidatus Sumerlaeota bacterium]|nr:cell division protein ZapA [Candidatus Sumerlaeota bacterium]